MVLFNKRLHFYPRPPRGGRQTDVYALIQSRLISIHALREEGDEPDRQRTRARLYFYPRPPRGGRLLAVQRNLVTTVFLSTPSARRATFYSTGWHMKLNLFLSTPSARRATPQVTAPTGGWAISIHALREEGDTAYWQEWKEMPNFYPRPPRGGRLIPPANASTASIISIHALREEGDCEVNEMAEYKSPISIHALREEGDAVGTHVALHIGNFYPRPPRGGRQAAADGKDGAEIFLSTPSARRATRAMASPNRGPSISIHALREEGDLQPDYNKTTAAQFLSTPSARRATQRYLPSPVT